METDKATTGFLRAEEAAVRLAEELQRLDLESSRYTAAAGALSGAGRALSELAAAVKETAGRTRDVIETVRDVGTPAMIASLDRVHAAAIKSIEASAAHSERIEGLRPMLAALDGALAEQSRRLSQLRTEHTESVNAMQQAISRAEERTEALNQEARSARDQASRQLRIVTWIGSVAAASSALGLIISILR